MPKGPHRGDAVAVNEDIAALDDFVAAHGDDAGAGQQERPGGEVAGDVEGDADFGGLVAGVVVGRGLGRSVGGRGVGGLGSGIGRVGFAGLRCLRSFNAVRKGLRVGQVVAEVCVSERPNRLGAVAAPRLELAARLGDPGDRNGCAGGTPDRDCRRLGAHLWDSHEVEVVAHLGQRPPPGG